ncbi:MAG: aminotransferase class I/II-fold pyridoxal phosphate-dependent enzyme, partial [Bacteroidia bacterium]|nr:aminotransferase class I/II-fold pyridoxal phosphate-dependent enzyme [Bacteroidia bacterium]
MKNFYSQKWNKKLFTSIQRHLCDYSDLIDFASNDYLGFAKDERIKNIIQEQFDKIAFKGSTGSRLISGNKKWIEDIEHDIAHIHHSEDALIFPSAYQANVGLLSCIADRQDVYLLDEHCHASIYDGVRLSFAKYYKFKHNDFADLKKRIDTCYASFDTIYVVVEGLYSMEGD